MAQKLTLSATKRETSGTGAAKRLRRQGIVPGVIYGSTQDNYSIQLNGREFADLIHRSASENMLVNLKIEGAKEAEKLAMAWNEMPSEKSWTWYPSYQCIFLCEYYLKTGDKRVLQTIEELTKRLYLAQVVDPSLYKDRMHGGQPQAFARKHGSATPAARRLAAQNRWH